MLSKSSSQFARFDGVSPRVVADTVTNKWRRPFPSSTSFCMYDGSGHWPSKSDGVDNLQEIIDTLMSPRHYFDIIYTVRPEYKGFFPPRSRSKTIFERDMFCTLPFLS